MRRTSLALRNSDHVIAHRQNAVMIENARRAAMRQHMIKTRLTAQGYALLAAVSIAAGIVAAFIV